MDMFSVFTWLAVAGIVGVLLYWHMQERGQSRADAAKSHHPPRLQRLIRVVPQAFGALLILQVIGVVRFPVPVPSGVREGMVIVGLVIFSLAAALAIWSRQTLGIHWAHAADLQVIPGQELVTSGPYSIIRHPIYVAFLCMFIGIELFVASWLIILSLPLLWFIVWQSKKEEELLEKEFGSVWRDYAQRTGMLFPLLRL